MAPESLTTIVSPKGKVILPKEILRALRWSAGTRLIVESTPDGVLLKPEPVSAETQPEDVFGSLAYDGPPKTVQEMNAGVLSEARRRHGSDRHQPRRPATDTGRRP